MKNSKLKILQRIIKLLKSNNYGEIQYIPANFSFLAIVKEFENITNFFLKKRHLLFYFSLFPNFYLFFLNEKLKVLYKIFFLNSLISLEELIKFIDKKNISESIQLGIIKKINKKYKFNLSFVPYKNYIFIRETYNVYKKYDQKEKNNTVWMGADSIIFLRFLNKYIKKNYFKNVLELGSGSGIVIGSISHKFKNCEAIDFNQKAVEFTNLNAKINNINNLRSYKSNLYKKIKSRFDLIIANPWFIDLKRGGLEEAPDIIKLLDKYLTKDGRCLLLMDSYLKNNHDTLENYFYELLQKKKYNVNLYTNGFFYDFKKADEYKKYKINYGISYNVEIKVNGSGTLKKYDAPFFRKIRDFVLIFFLYILKKIKN